MNDSTSVSAHGVRGKNIKTKFLDQLHPPNYIVPEIPHDHHGPSQFREQRPVKKKRIESHQHWAALVLEDDGSISLRSSASLKRVRNHVLQDALPLFQQHTTGSYDEEEKPVAQQQTDPVPLPQTTSESTISYPFKSKRRRVDSEPAETHTRSDTTRAEEPLSTSESAQFGSSMARSEPPCQLRMIEIRFDDYVRWRRWFGDAFKACQQQCCRAISKEWIKAIHPKKQSTHPYNGNMPRHERKSPERTRPPYWPPNVRHKEPDHIDKADRTELLVHLIMNTPQPEIVPNKMKSEKKFHAKDLLAVLEKKQDDFIVDKMDIIRHIIDARTELEVYEDGGYDGDATFSVPDFGELIRSGNPSKRKKTNTGAVTRTTEGEETWEDAEEDEPINTPPESDDTPADDMPDINSHDNMDVMKIETSSSSRSTNDCDIKSEAAGRFQPIRHPYQRDRPECNGFGPRLPGMEQQTMHTNQQGQVARHSFDGGQPEMVHRSLLQPIDYHHHPSISREQHFVPQSWPVTTGSGPEMSGMLDEDMMLAHTPLQMIDQSHFEGVIPIRSRSDHEMVPPNPYHDSQHFHFGLDPQTSFHINSMEMQQRAFHVNDMDVTGAAMEHSFNHSGNYY